jgi:hypothetical protein
MKNRRRRPEVPQPFLIKQENEEEALGLTQTPSWWCHMAPIVAERRIDGQTPRFQGGLVGEETLSIRIPCIPLRARASARP